MKGSDNMDSIEEFEKTIGYEFKDKKLIYQALSHSSFANERKNTSGSNERLEFLGDSVLSLVVSEYIYKNLSHTDEGDLTKIRASLVCEKSLYDFAKKIDLGKYIMLGKGEENTGGRKRPSILADAFEAVIAAVYLDGGMDAAARHILKFIPEDIQGSDKAFNDYKTILQEIVQKNPEEKVEYTLVGESGPAHDKNFVVDVCLNSQVIGRGNGKSKKEAEQLAAKEALELMGYEAQ